MDTCLIDGDVVVYICGFAAQQTWYTCEVDQSEHATRKLALAHLESIGELDEDGGDHYYCSSRTPFSCS